MEMDCPSREDWYDSQTAMEIRRIYYALIRKKDSINLKDFQLKFSKKTVNEEDRKLYEERITQVAKSNWALRMGKTSQKPLTKEK